MSGGEGMAVDRPREGASDVDTYKEIRLYISQLLEERCEGSTDALNVLARLETGLRAVALYVQEDAAKVEEAFQVGMKAFLDYESGGGSRPRSTRAR